MKCGKCGAVLVQVPMDWELGKAKNYVCPNAPHTPPAPVGKGKATDWKDVAEGKKSVKGTS